MPRCPRTPPTRPKAGMRRIKGPSGWRNKARKSRRSLSEARELIETPDPSQTPRNASRCNPRALLTKPLTRNGLLDSSGRVAVEIAGGVPIVVLMARFQPYRPDSLSANAKAPSTAAPLSIPAQSSGTQRVAREGEGGRGALEPKAKGFRSHSRVWPGHVWL